jgi:hypothetical protein
MAVRDDGVHAPRREVEQMPDIPESTKHELRDSANAIGELFKKVGDLTDLQPTADDLIEQLIASHDRLREELAAANQKLDRILTTRKPSP